MPAFQDFNVLHKQVFAEKMKNLVPEFVKLSELITFSEDESTGRYFEQPLQMTLEHGFSYTGNTVVTLSAEIAAEFVEAQVDGREIILGTQVGYLQAAKMSTSKKAFAKAGTVIYESMLRSAHKRLEISILYGQSATGLGVVVSNTAGVLVITDASWSPGIWSGMRNCIIEGFSPAGAQRNADLTITNVNITNKSITVTGTNAAVVAGDVLFFKGSRVNDMIGIDKIVLNTGSLYNVDAAVYELWNGNVYSAGAASATLAKVVAAAGVAAGRGCMEELTLVCSTKTFANLTSNEAALRDYAGETTGTAENGFDTLKFFGPNGRINVIPHIFCKEGEAFLIPAKRCKRIGSSDISFKIAGGISTEDIWFNDPATNSWKLRLYSHQNTFCEMPAFLVKITNIVNS